jgi:hypothetical protein
VEQGSIFKQGERQQQHQHGQQQQQRAVQQDVAWTATLGKIQSGLTHSLVKHLASHPSSSNGSTGTSPHWTGSSSSSTRCTASAQDCVTVNSDFVTELLKVVVQRLPSIAPQVQLLVLPVVLPERVGQQGQGCGRVMGATHHGSSSSSGSSSSRTGGAGGGSGSVTRGGSRRVVTRDGVVRCDEAGGSGSSGGGISGPKLLNLNVPFVMQLQQVWEALPWLRMVLVMGGDGGVSVSGVTSASGIAGIDALGGGAVAASAGDDDGGGLAGINGKRQQHEVWQEQQQGLHGLGDGGLRETPGSACGPGYACMPGLPRLGVSSAILQAVRSIVAACLDRLSLPGPADSLD